MELQELESLQELHRVMGIMGIKKYSEDNFKIMEFIMKEFKKIGTVRPSFESAEFTPQQLMGSGLRTLRIYDRSVFERANDEFSSKRFLIMTEPCQFNTNVVFSANKETEDGEYVVKKDSGHVDHFKISAISCLSDIIWYAHEAIHACKDTNYNEYIDLCRYSDVLPIFHEFVSSMNLNQQIFDEWLKIRYTFIFDNIKRVKEAITLKNNDHANANAYNIQIGLAGHYLTSFYYALLLFNLYLEKPREVIYQVNKVLKQEQTTEELLTNLKILKPNSVLNNTFNGINKKFVSQIRR
jgi:hypothetical protein